MRIVVIGATGHIGGYLIPRLVVAGHEVIAVTRGTSQPYRDDPAWESVRRVALDRDVEDAAGRFGDAIADLKPDVVVDMICFTEASAAQLLDALRGRVAHLIHVGTIWVHGTAVEVPITEAAPRRPWGDYGSRKAAIERIYLAEGSDTAVTVVHPGHISGPGWPIVNPQGNHELDPWRALADGVEIVIPNFGLETVHHVHADDVAQLIELCIAQPQRAQGEAFHAVSDRAMTLRGLAETAAGWFGQTAQIRCLPFEQFRGHVTEAAAATTYEHIARSHSISIEKSSTVLGYRPTYSSAEAAQEAVTWLAENGRLGTHTTMTDTQETR